MGPDCTQISNPVMWISCGKLVENLLNTDPASDPNRHD